MNHSNPAHQFDVDIHDDFITPAECADLMQKIQALKFPHPTHTKSGALSKRRNKLIFGEIDHYTIVIRGKTIHTHVQPWGAFPELHRLKCAIEAATEQTYQVCVLQFYNNGDVGIAPHRDREMRPGTKIASLSLGCTRVMKFERGGDAHVIALAPGCLCVINPPTNDYWAHSIPTDRSTTPRVSLVFRNCEGMC